MVKTQKSSRYNRRPNKLLGQHFLHSKGVVLSLIEGASLTRSDTVLEVGPGRGFVTDELSRSANRVIAIEKDPELVRYLQNKFGDSMNVNIVRGDILRIDIGRIIQGSYKVVASLPYYLTSRFLRNMLARKNKPRSMSIIVQHEVAKRMVEKPPHMNLLALSVQVFGKVTYKKRLPSTLFKPRPRVDSAIVTITSISDDFFKKNNVSQNVFFALARRAFSQKRKTLKNSLGIQSNKRPQELSLTDWLKLCNQRIRLV